MKEERMPDYAHPMRIAERLSGPLPGPEAHRTLMSYRRQEAAEARTLEPPPRQSAVLMLIFPWEEAWSTLFMERPANQGVHSGQLSFPGGKMEEGDTDLWQTALRETSEEVGIDPAAIQRVGALSEVYIPPSHFVVQPYVGWMDHRPSFVPNPTEVSELLIEPLDRFFQPGAIRSGRIFLPAYQMHIHAPYFEVQGRMLWGATAMMLQEFRVAMSGPEIPAG